MAVEAGPGRLLGLSGKRGICSMRDANLNADEEKRKYFKILPNHIAPQGAKYSQEGVKKEREVEKVGVGIFFRLCYALSWLFSFLTAMPVPIFTIVEGTTLFESASSALRRSWNVVVGSVPKVIVAVFVGSQIFTSLLIQMAIRNAKETASDPSVNCRHVYSTRPSSNTPSAVPRLWIGRPAMPRKADQTFRAKYGRLVWSGKAC